jgi:hypothetical protein
VIARIAGRNSLVYAGSGILSNSADWTIDTTAASMDVSQLGDDWVQTLRGQRSGSGTITGPVDTSSTSPWDLANANADSSGPIFIYPQKTVMGSYYYMNAWFECNVTGGVTTPVRFSMKFTSDGPISTH